MRAHASCAGGRAHGLAAAKQASLREQSLDGGGVVGTAALHVVGRALLRLLQAHRGCRLLLAGQLAQKLVQQSVCTGAGGRSALVD